ncbi:MAG: UDP-3-O-acyl-N-acetylglucosamine deacetylase, partial [Mesorhizobium sp.]
VEAGASWAEFRPYDGTRFEVEIDFESPAIGRQLFASDINPDIFRRDIARARTFGFMKDVERLWAAGYALGSSLENSLVIGDDN